jgi:hypothetical protein
MFALLPFTLIRERRDNDMKSFLKIAALAVALAFTVPSVQSQAQVSVQVNLGNPAVRPWPDAVWVPGYYYYDPVQVRRVYVAGRWRHDNGLHKGWYKEHGKGHGRGRDH